MKISDEELSLLNQKGFIPGPNEGEEEFLKRTDYCLNLKRQFAADLGQQLPVEAGSMPPEVAQNVNPITKNLFDIVLDWVPIVFSNYKMSFWHGGCAWIFQMSEDSPTSAFFQLRKTFEKSQRYLGMYDRIEIIAHESAHVGRMKFDEPKFEEVLAYRTATSSFRKWIGPIFQSSWESLVFVLLLFLCIFGEFYLINNEISDSAWRQLFTWLQFIVLGMIFLGLVRVLWRQRQLSQCLKALKILFGTDEKADAVTYRLLDKEIIAFGKMSSEEINEYAEKQKNDTLRWRSIYHSYFMPK